MIKIMIKIFEISFNVIVEISFCRIVFVVVCAFIFVGTLYDAILRYKILHGTGTNNISNNIITESKLTTTNGGKLNPRITLSRLWTVTTHNGSLGRFLQKISLPLHCSIFKKIYITNKL